MALLSIITVAAFDVSRLSKTISSITPILSEKVEHIIIHPLLDAEVATLLQDNVSKSPYRKVYLDEGKGIYPAMNVGIQQANGAYCWFINSGDEIVKQSIPSVLQVLNGGALVWIIGQGKFDWREPQKLSDDNLRRFREGREDGFISHQTVIARTDALKEIGGFNQKYRVAADTDLIAKFSNKFSPFWIQEVIAYVERPKFAAHFNRRGRFETFSIAMKSGRLRAAARILMREIDSYMNRNFP